MKKTFGIMMGIIGAIIIGAGIVFKVKGNVSSTIIGGADGPTSIYLVGNQSSIPMIIIGIIVLAIGVIVLLKRRK